MDLLKRLELLRKVGDITTRRKAATAKKREAAVAARRAQNEEASRLAVAKAQQEIAQRAAREELARERRQAKQVTRAASSDWGNAPVKRVPVYEWLTRPYAGARQITFRVGFRDGNLRFDEEGLRWLQAHAARSLIALRVVTRTGGLFEQSIAVENLGPVLAEYRSMAA